MIGIRTFLVASLVSFASLSSAFAGVVLKGATHFTTTGAVTSFQWAPASYTDATHPNPFFYDIFYYIPDAVAKTPGKVKAVIFDHGGGASTMDRAGSVKTVGLYLPDLKKLADDLGIIVVLPAANGLNWGGHTVTVQRNLLAMMRKELNVDSDNIGLSGHSMGGMGITRAYYMLADQFSFFLPLSAGMDLEYSKDPYVLEEQINKVFNVPYIHLEGLQDSFQIFVDRCRKQLAMTQALEQKYGVKSKLDIFFYDAPHNYDLNVFRQHLASALATKRDLYQSELWGTVSTQNRFAVENNITYHVDTQPRYFWVEAVGSDLSTPERIDFHAKVESNTVKIDINQIGGSKIPVRTKKLRVYLSHKLENLLLPVHIVINGKEVLVAKPLARIPYPHSMDPTDSSFTYDAYVDAPIPQN